MASSKTWAFLEELPHESPEPGGFCCGCRVAQLDRPESYRRALSRRKTVWTLSQLSPLRVSFSYRAQTSPPYRVLVVTPLRPEEGASPEATSWQKESKPPFSFQDRNVYFLISPPASPVVRKQHTGWFSRSFGQGAASAQIFLQWGYAGSAQTP